MKQASCEYCGKHFEAIRITGKYCSPSCRVKACLRRKDQSIEPKTPSEEVIKGLEINANPDVINGTHGANVNANKTGDSTPNQSNNAEQTKKPQLIVAKNNQAISNISNFLIRNKNLVYILLASATIYWGSKSFSQQSDTQKKKDIANDP